MSAIFEPVDNHKVPPEDFIDVMVDTIKGMDDSVFAPIAKAEVYSAVGNELPYTKDPLTRKAYMCEILRCLAAFESDYNWNEGADSTAGPEKSDEVETGAFQVSANSMNFGNLREFAKESVGIVTTQQFIDLIKTKHSFAVQYIIRLLRITVAANGPILHKHINGWLSMDAVNEFKSRL